MTPHVRQWHIHVSLWAMPNTTSPQRVQNIGFQSQARRHTMPTASAVAFVATRRQTRRDRPMNLDYLNSQLHKQANEVTQHNDILAYSRSPDEHLRHLERILAKLDTELYAKLGKCNFALKSVKFLGHVISAQGISLDPSKVQLVQDWPPPRNLADLRSFVGLASYFRKFIPLFASITACLTRLFRKGTAWAWIQACQTAFDTVKTLLTTALVLKLPDYNHEFTVVVDASGVGIGAVLLQDERPVAFGGRKLTDTELKWSTTEQEMLAVVHHLNKWRCYLEGRHFVVVTDHEPNTWFHRQQKLNPRQNRWYEFIAGHDFTWQYRPGRSNMADPLSKHPASSAILCCGATCAVATRSQRNATLPDAATSKETGHAAHAERPVFGPARPPVQPEPSSSSTPITADTKGSTYKGNTLPVPNSPSNKDAMQIPLDIKQGFAADPLYSPAQASQRDKLGLTLNAAGLWTRAGLVTVPANSVVRKVILRELHCSPYAGHFGVQRTQELISRYYSWLCRKKSQSSFGDVLPASVASPCMGLLLVSSCPCPCLQPNGRTSPWTLWDHYHAHQGGMILSLWW